MDLAAQLLFALLLAIPVACIAWTVTQEEIFRELREGLKAFQRRHPESVCRQKLAYVPTCPYCFSHYVSALFVFLFQFTMLVDDWRGYVASLLTVVLIANVYISLYNLLRVTLRRAKAAADKEEAEVQLIRKRGVNPAFTSGTRWRELRVADEEPEEADREPAVPHVYPPDARCPENAQVGSPGRCKVMQESRRAT